MNALIRSLAESLLPILIVAAAGCPFQRLIPLDNRSISRMARYDCIPAPILRLLDRPDISPAERLRMVAFGATMLGPLPLTPLLMVRSA